MTPRWVIPLLVALAFTAGFAARMWTERHRALPSPPPPGSEFVRTSAPVSGENAAPANGDQTKGLNRAKLIAEIEKVRPQVDVYRQRMEEIGKEFDQEFVSLLTAEQRTHFDARQKRHAEKKAKRDADEANGTQLTDQQIEDLRRQPLWNALWNVAINWRLENLSKEYKLSGEQQGQVCVLLKTRREKFLALVDSTPPPSISYSELARRAQKLAEPKN